jgi:hypothetical protein
VTNPCKSGIGTLAVLHGNELSLVERMVHEQNQADRQMNGKRGDHRPQRMIRHRERDSAP